MKTQGCALALTFALFFVSAGTAVAWGPDGHRAVCQIAYLHLDKAHQAEVNRLARKMKVPHGLTKFTSFPQGCIFPDEVRANKGAEFARFQQFNEWHFLNVPRSAKTVAEEECHDNCVLKGIAFHSSALKDAANDQDRAEALLFLGHWVGDVHQPLHISYADDKGGNDIKPIHGIYPKSPKLHSVWDSGIIMNDMKASGHDGWKAYANHLNGKITAANRTDWLGGTAVDWAGESYKITILPDVLYCKENTDGTSCDPFPDHSRTLEQPYQDEFHDDVETRLEQAGIRLADIIQANLTVHH